MECKEVVNKEGQQYHIQCKKGDIGKYVLLPGDPFRTDIIASFLTDAKIVAHNREHKTWTGYLNGEKVSVTSTGMGCPSAAIAVEELIHCGAEKFIRIGTCGRVCEDSLNPQLKGAVITGSVRDEGTTVHYIPIEYPAIADRSIVSALAESAKQNNYSYIEGIAQSKDSFYGQHDPDGLPNGQRLKERWEAWRQGNVVASEMETAALFVIAQIRKVQAGAIMAYEEMNKETIQVAIDAISILMEKDASSKSENAK